VPPWRSICRSAKASSGLASTGMVNTYAGLIIPVTFNAFGIFLLRQFYLGIPLDLQEAAIIDGASYWGIYWNIMLPLSRPI
jgi:multiple sugar transport system permease protein